MRPRWRSTARLTMAGPSPLPSLASRVGTVKAIEYALALLWEDTGTAVLDLQHRVGSLGKRAHDNGSTSWRVTDGVVDHRLPSMTREARPRHPGPGESSGYPGPAQPGALRYSVPKSVATSRTRRSRSTGASAPPGSCGSWRAKVSNCCTRRVDRCTPRSRRPSAAALFRAFGTLQQLQLQLHSGKRRAQFVAASATN